ncbi:MAG: TIM barrel protein [Acidobacteria bacterium]|nr:TIM barrel protein [Acidobacteriota bacterium]
MQRRTLLSLPAAGALASTPSRPRLKLSVRVEPLFPSLTLPAQIEKVAEAGYQGFEFGDWRAADAGQIVALKNRLKLDCVCLVGNRSVNPKGMGLCDPAEREGFLTELRASADAARRFESRMLVVLSGFKIPGLSRAQQHASMVEGLKRAHDIVAPLGITLIVEVINTLAPVEPLNPKGNNHADYFLDRTPEAFAMVREVGSPFVKILYDLYHVQIMEGNLIETVRQNISAIGHIHVADVPGRHEPGTGEINFGQVFRAIEQTGFSGYVGMEYIPTKDALATLVDVRRLAWTDR